MSEAPKNGIERAYVITLESLRKNGLPLVGINKLQDLCKERFGVGGNTEALSEGRDLAHTAWLKEEAARPEPKAKQAERTHPETSEEQARDRLDTPDRDYQGASAGAQVAVMKEFIDGAVSRIVGPLTTVHQGQIAELKEAYQGQITGLKEIHKEQLAELRQTVLWYRRGAVTWVLGTLVVVIAVTGGVAYGAYWIGAMQATANSHSRLPDKVLPTSPEGVAAVPKELPAEAPAAQKPPLANDPPTAPLSIQPVVADPKP